MSQFVAIRNGGKTDENGALRFLRRASSNGQGYVASGDVKVSQHSSPNNSVDVAVGDLVIAYQDYIFYTWIDAIYNVTPVTANSSGNGRIDSVVAYVDLSVVSSASSNNPGALKFIIVAGTPSGSPVAPSGATVQAAVGAGNPYYILANLTVPNGFSGGSQMLNAAISDQRAPYLLGTGAKFGFYLAGSQAVANDQGWNPPVPIAQSMTTIFAYAKTAPTGSSLTIRIYNITQSLAVGTISISAGSQTAQLVGLTNPSLNAGDILRIDVTAIGATIPGSDISVIMF